MELGIKELEKIANGTAGLMGWEESVKTFKR